MQAVKAQMSLHLCADSPEPSLLVNAISGNLVHLPRYDWLVNVVKHVTKRLSASMEAQRGHSHYLSITATPPHRDYMHYKLALIAMIFDFLGHYCLGHAARPKSSNNFFWYNMILFCSNKFGHIATS